MVLLLVLSIIGPEHAVKNDRVVLSRDKTAGRARSPILGSGDGVVCTLFKAVLGHVAEPGGVVLTDLKELVKVAAQDNLLTRVSRVDRDQGRGSE